jgi:hypothetical protein
MWHNHVLENLVCERTTTLKYLEGTNRDVKQIAQPESLHRPHLK